MDDVIDENFKHSTYIALNCFYIEQSLQTIKSYCYLYLLKMYSLVKFIYIYVCVRVCVHTLLSIYMSKMSSRDYENLTTN